MIIDKLNFYPLYVREKLYEITSINSLLILFKSPIKWIKTNKSLIKHLLKGSLLFFFSRPKLKWLDKHIEGYLNFKQAKNIYNLIKRLPNNSVIVEIGAYLGRSTCFISEAIKNKEVEFYSIDTFENQSMSEGLRNTFREYYKNIYPYRKKIKIVKGFSLDVIKNFQDIEIDFLFLDADHSYEATRKDIIDWYPIVKKNKYIVFHDYYQRKGNVRVKKAVDEKIKEKKLKKVKLVNHLLITRKIGN